MDPSIATPPLAEHRFEINGRQVLSGFLAAFMLMVTWCYNIFFVPAALVLTIFEYKNNRMVLVPVLIIDAGLLFIAITGTVIIFWLSRGVLSLRVLPTIAALVFGVGYIVLSIQIENLTVSGVMFVICSAWAVLLIIKERFTSHKIRKHQ
jgi:hypothetical protein